MPTETVQLASGLVAGVLTDACLPISESDQFVVKSFTFCNTHTGSVTLTVNFANYETEDGYSIVSSMTLDPGDTLSLLESGQIIALQKPQRIKALASVDGVVSYVAHGENITQ